MKSVINIPSLIFQHPHKLWPENNFAHMHGMSWLNVYAIKMQDIFLYFKIERK